MTGGARSSGMKPIEHAAPREAYDRWATVYDHDGNPLVALDDDVVPRLLGDVRGREVLELACGTGRHTARLADAGARVTAVDFSRGMLEQARARCGDRAVRFVEHDITTPLGFDDASFDAVVCCLALEHVRDLAPFFAEARRVLRPGGALVVSDMHPAMRLRGKQAKFDDPIAGVEVLVDGFLHPVSEYVMAAIGAGLALETIAEHSPDEALAAKFPRASKYVGWPMLVALRARR